MILKHGHFAKQIRNRLKVLKSDAGEGWRSDHLTREKMKKFYKAQGKKGT